MDREEEESQVYIASPLEGLWVYLREEIKGRRNMAGALGIVAGQVNYAYKGALNNNITQ